jgi:integrase
VASVWITRRETASGPRYRVRYRPGGAESPIRYAGSFRTRREALARKQWVAGELAALRMPDVRALERHRQAPTLREAAARWRDSRVDASEATRLQHRSAVNRMLPLLGARRVDELTPADVAELVSELHAAGSARETIRKSLTALKLILDHTGALPNVARDPSVKLPREEREEPQPPSAEHVEAVYHLLPSKHRLALLFLDWSGARVGSIDSTLVGDYDEWRRRVRLRAATTKTRRALWVELQPALADAIEASLPPREDRNPEARLFAGSGADALRTSIAKGCRALGIPLWSPHDLRHRRISLLHLRGVPWARIGELVGQRNLAVTANTYSHVLLDEAELEYERLISARK